MTTADRTPGTAEVLRGAADVIRSRGWAQGVSERSDGSVCVMRAIAIASPTIAGSALARTALVSAIGMPYVTDWNDAPETTAEEVITALEQAAEATATWHLPMPLPPRNGRCGMTAVEGTVSGWDQSPEWTAQDFMLVEFAVPVGSVFAIGATHLISAAQTPTATATAPVPQAEPGGVEHPAAPGSRTDATCFRECTSPVTHQVKPAEWATEDGPRPNLHTCRRHMPDAIDQITLTGWCPAVVSTNTGGAS